MKTYIGILLVMFLVGCSEEEVAKFEENPITADVTLENTSTCSLVRMMCSSPNGIQVIRLTYHVIVNSEEKSGVIDNAFTNPLITERDDTNCHQYTDEWTYYKYTWLIRDFKDYELEISYTKP